MNRDDLGMHAKAWLGAGRMIKEHAERQTDQEQRKLFYALAHVAGFVGNAYFDMWGGREPGSMAPLEPYQDPTD
ncbi:hypothetical protein [Bradyrhizobium stylosanthis]|uniref:Uncharacterized protein n=1 Tax=Bradyrhizobium stylosanthis TaxID=1803665 RepID=A0A560CXN7_9BRAD|nr:hypothetical protein [Bradyrhizobium stylosanthis]TWA89596.1 hypothetical protein FBZ96_11964 [Bradyrhizobium stylosanthis]